MNIQALADFLDSVKDKVDPMIPMIEIVDCIHWCITENQDILVKYKEGVLSWEISEGDVSEEEFTILNLDKNSKLGFTAVLHNACRLSEDEFNEKYQ